MEKVDNTQKQMAIIRLIYSSSGNQKNGYTVKCTRKKKGQRKHRHRNLESERNDRNKTHC